MKKIIYISILVICVISFSSCNNKDEISPSIFDTSSNLNPNSAGYSFDLWLYTNYTKTYNLDFRYKLEDVTTNMDYNLVPVSFAKAQQIAKLVKYLWFDAYAAVLDSTFMQANGPKIISLIGSPAYNPNSGSMLLGTAEGGIKITLYNGNGMDVSNIDQLNWYYFRTMHHEFAHILNQKRNYPIEFAAISEGYYNSLNWTSMTATQAASLGFVTAYAGSEEHEDFVETLANYLIKTDAQWNDLLDIASKPGIDATGVDLPDDGVDGKAKILLKLNMVSKYLKDIWKLDIVQLHNEIMKREANINSVLNN
ncbi:MAG: putative zinc-binding metallopeptidase [Paludibacter sp.]